MSSAVNRPTDVKVKEGDVNRKLQLYGIYSAFANGKVPSNKQIDVALNSLLASKALTSPNKLSTEGQGLVKDLKEVIEQAKFLLLSKNEGELLQDFIWQTQQISGGNAALPGAPVDKATAQQHGNQALEGLRTLGTLILSNGQFRKLLNDATILFRDMAGDAAQNAANKVNPSQDQLSQIDHAADDNTWHDVPDLSPAALKSQGRDAFNKNKPFNKGDLKEAAGDATQNAHPSGTRDPQEAAEYSADSQQNGEDPSQGVDPRGGAMAAKDSLMDRSNLSEEDKERAKQKAQEVKSNTKQQARGYLGSKMPKERREQTIYRLKKMVVEIQGHSDYQQAIETLLNLAEEYGGHGLNVTQQGAGTVKGAHADTALTAAETDLRTLIERFANSTSADDLIEAVNNIYRDADRDPELKNWFKQIDTYIRKCLQETGFIMQDSATEEWNQLYDRGNFLLRDRYKNHTDRIVDEFRFMGTQFDQDPQNKAFANAVNKLFKDLGQDENGKVAFKKHLLNDISTVILPGAFENVRYIPIPRIEYSDPMMDAIVENLVIESDNLTPNSLELTSDNHFVWGRKSVVSSNKNKVILAVSGCQMDLRDVSYYVNKKQGFPSIKDKGVMDIFMGGSGFSFKAGLETADSKDRQHFFKVNTVNVEVKNLKIKIKQSSHKLLLAIAKPLLLKILKPVIQKVLEKQIRDSINQVDGYAYEINKEANRAAEAAKSDPENAQNIYSRYVQAAQAKMNKGQKKAQEASANTKVNVAMTQQDSIFKDIKLPGGISSKATDYKNLAAQGERWQSPVFGIGGAAPSTNIPRVSNPTRKTHNAASGGIRGPQNIDSSHSNLGNASTANTSGSAMPAQQSYGGNNQGTDRSYSNGGNNQGFSNQVNQAFESNGNQDYSLKNGQQQEGQNGKTMFGANNPVFSGNL